jgi:hypothetical protein
MYIIYVHRVMYDNIRQLYRVFQKEFYNFESV